MAHLLGLFDDCLKSSKAEQTELVCESEDFYLTRFADNVIHQNMGRKDHKVWCRAINGKKVGIATGNDITRDAINLLIEKAGELCKYQEENPQFAGLVLSPRAAPSNGYIDSTAKYSAESRATAVSIFGAIASAEKLKVSGMFETSQTELIVANSLGTRQSGKASEAKISVTLSDDITRAGFAQAFARDVAQIDYEGIAIRAIQKAYMPQRPISLEPGKYTVILDPEAVADFLLFLGFLGFGGKGLVTRRSFMAEKIGTQIMSDKISIYEDPHNPEIEYIGFDYEGVPRRRVPLIEKGFGKGVVNDSYYGNLNGSGSTGNALRPGNNFGPYPVAMTIEPGTQTLEQIMASCDRAIWITHFWYLNYLNPMMTTVTGTTRDGTFLIEDGKLKSPIVDMRVSQSMLEAFSNVEAISGTRRLVPKYGTIMFVPAFKIANFNLTAKD